MKVDRMDRMNGMSLMPGFSENLISRTGCLRYRGVADEAGLSDFAGAVAVARCRDYKSGGALKARGSSWRRIMACTVWATCSGFRLWTMTRLPAQI